MVNKRIESILKERLNSSIYEYGFADLSGLLFGRYKSFSYGISILRKLDDSIINGIDRFPTIEYNHHYNKVNAELNDEVLAISKSLTNEDYQFCAVKATVDDEELDETFKQTLSYYVSHKMVATRAGLGWIGKTDLLVSHRFGPRARLASILTNYPLNIVNKPNEFSLCGNCSVCVDNCPGEAANGMLWNLDMPRDSFFNPFKCREYCRQKTKEYIGIDNSLCGKCISVCPMGK